MPYLNQLRLGNGVAFQSKIDENTIRLTHLFVLCPFVARNARKLKSEICLTPKYNFQKTYRYEPNEVKEASDVIKLSF